MNTTMMHAFSKVLPKEEIEKSKERIQKQELDALANEIIDKLQKEVRDCLDRGEMLVRRGKVEEGRRMANYAYKIEKEFKEKFGAELPRLPKAARPKKKK